MPQFACCQQQIPLRHEWCHIVGLHWITGINLCLVMNCPSEWQLRTAGLELGCDTVMLSSHHTTEQTWWSIKKSQIRIAVDPHDGGQSLVVVPEAAAPRPGGHQGSAASDAVCLGCVASCQYYSQVSVPTSRQSSS